MNEKSERFIIMRKF